MKAQAVAQQVMVHQHRGAKKPHGAHHGRRVQRRLRHADGAREGVNHRPNHQIGQTLMGQSVTLWSTAELYIVMCSPCNFGKLSIYLQRET